MARSRRDGEATRARLVQAACEAFGEKGFHEATHEDICRRAEANTAAINYHFGSKEGLYRAVWSHTTGVMQERYPAEALDATELPAAKRLERFVKTMLRKMSDRDILGHCHRLHMREALQPTGLVDDLIREARAPYRAQLLGIVGELLGPDSDPETVELCDKSVIGQIRILNLAGHHAPSSPPPPVDEERLEALATHIVRFSLAGIAASRSGGRE